MTSARVAPPVLPPVTLPVSTVNSTGLSASTAPELLRVQGLQVDFINAETRVCRRVIQSINFSISAGKTLALVGESGSGKSVTAMALLRLLPRNLTEIRAEAITLSDGKLHWDLSQGEQKTLQQVRSRQVGVVFQEPMIALNPVHKLGKQIIEVFSLHRDDLRRKDYPDAALALLADVGIKDCQRVFACYPHQVSGGMRQRVMIAIAIAANPILLIADEPTTSLDVTIQAKILRLLSDLQAQRKMGMLFISHNFAVVRALADDIAVMQAGQIIEQNTCDELLATPQQPYSCQLIADSALHARR